VTATDDVVSQHGPDDPLALVATGGQTAPYSGGTAPPDTQIADGDGFVVQVVNEEIAIFDRGGALVHAVDKNGNPYRAVLSTNIFFNLPRTGDPKVVFDAGADRWYISMLDLVNTDAGDAVFLAVSQTADPTGSWDVYRVVTVASNRFADQPRLGFSSDKVLIEYSNLNRLTFPSFCFTCFDDYMIVIQKSDLTSKVASPRGIAIDLSTETNHRLSVIPAIPLPSAEVPTAYAIYRGHDLIGTYDSTLVIIGLPSANTVAFKETGPKIPDTSTPPLASQPGVSTQVDTNQAYGDDVLSVSLVSASTTDYSAVLWSAGATGCTPSGSSTEQACARIDKVGVDGAGNATITSDYTLGVAGSDILYPAVVGDASGTHVWVAGSVSGPVFPTSKLWLLTFGTLGGVTVRSLTYGSGAYPDTEDCDQATPRPCPVIRFGDYSGIYVDSSETTGATVWASTENASPTPSGTTNTSLGGWSTSIVEATFLTPGVSHIAKRSGFAGDTVDVYGAGFSQDALVSFGAVPSTQVMFLGSDHLQAIVPPQNPTTVHVLVTTLKGTDTPLAGTSPTPDEFTYKFLLWASGTDPAGNVVAIDPTLDKRHFSVDTGTGPTVGVAVSRNASTVYATSPTSASLLWIDATHGTLQGVIHLGVHPSEIALSADGTFAFVTDPGAFGGYGGVIPVSLNTSTGMPTPLAPVKVGLPLGVATATTGQVYVTSGRNKAVIILTSGSCGLARVWCITNTLPMPKDVPGPIASGPNVIVVGGTKLGAVYTINPTSPGLSAPLGIGAVPSAIAVSPNGFDAFAISASSGRVYPIGLPSNLLPSFALPRPLGGGVVSFNSRRLFVAGGNSAQINTAVVPTGPSSQLHSGPSTSTELATNLPPTTSCGSGNDWGGPSTSLAVNQVPSTIGTLVTVTASILHCAKTMPGAATPVLTVTPPTSPLCPPAYMDQNPSASTANGLDTFAFQFVATCPGQWTATPSLTSFVGFGTSPPAFNPASITIVPPTLTTVTFSGTVANPTITLNGSGFGEAPSGANVPPGGCGATGSDYELNSLYLQDTTANWNAGMAPNDCVGLIEASYTDQQVAFNFGSYYDSTLSLSPITLVAGDSFTVGIDGATCSETVPTYPGTIAC